MTEKKIPCPICKKPMCPRSSMCWNCHLKTRATNWCSDCGKPIRKNQNRCWECHKAHIAIPETVCQDCKKPLRKYGKGTRCKTCSLKHRHQQAKKWYCQDCKQPVKRRRKRCPDCHRQWLNQRGPTYKRTPETRRKTSQALKGIKPWTTGKSHSPETIIKMQDAWTEERRQTASANIRGKKNPGYIHGKKGRPWPREFNSKLRAKIRKRDHYICQLCNKPFPKRSKRIGVHHIDYDKRNNIPSNLICLCVSCHAKTNFRRSEWQRYFQALQSLREHNKFLSAKDLPANDILSLPPNPGLHMPSLH